MRSVSALAASLVPPLAFLTACTGLEPGSEPFERYRAEIAKSGFNSDEHMDLQSGFGFKTLAEAKEAADTHKGQKGSVSGYVEDIQVNGNRATLHLLPVRSTELGFRCIGEPEYARPACLREKRSIYNSSVTCHIDNWAALDNATGNVLLKNLEYHWDHVKAWDHMLVAGIIDDSEQKLKTWTTIGTGGGVGAGFGMSGGLGKDGFYYQTIHLKNCRVYTWRSVHLPY
ncbi:hypothetical protein [Salaquimonas pukyongi]|uniref:hypothetical protein n=1 Tax=Salaquimonas pukyongi TaxID=2712698 RepID=UPI00096B7C2F|nr:hypothetical protein [Salaquimonas pukyongi]